AERRARAVNLVRADLLALSAAADDDAAVGLAGDDEAGDLGADGWIVDGRFVVGPAIVHVVAETGQRRDHVLLQREPRVIGADRDAHRMQIISCRPLPLRARAKTAHAPAIHGSIGATSSRPTPRRASSCA